MKKPSLTEQLLLICISIVLIVIIALGIVLPRTLLPVYEENLYSYLENSLNLLDSPKHNLVNEEVAYIYIDNNDNVYVSDNLNKVAGIDNTNDIIGFITDNAGNFKIKNNLYYYTRLKADGLTKIAICNDSYINFMKAQILRIILLVVGITFIIISLLIIIWSNNLVNRIKKLKDKIDNINNDDYDHENIYDYDDELHTLEVAIENMRVYLKEQEEYKNQMYQNISHDFKTPITVMKSYIEASDDGIQTKEKTINVFREQLNKLEVKVHSLLYLNKLNYYKDSKNMLNEKCDISKIIYEAVDKFSPSRSDVQFKVDIDKKSTLFRGSEEMWEAIIDNILNNFIRYAKKKISITVKNNKITLYNDGPNIDKDVLTNIFTPYEKGVKGVFGLGLSIVKKTLYLLNYDVNIVNEKNGVKFIIS